MDTLSKDPFLSVDELLFDVTLRIARLSLSNIFLLVEGEHGRRCCGSEELIEAYVKGLMVPLDGEKRIRFDPRSKPLKEISLAPKVVRDVPSFDSTIRIVPSSSGDNGGRMGEEIIVEEEAPSPSDSLPVVSSSPGTRYKNIHLVLERSFDDVEEDSEDDRESGGERRRVSEPRVDADDVDDADLVFIPVSSEAKDGSKLVTGDVLRHSPDARSSSDIRRSREEEARRPSATREREKEEHRLKTNASKASRVRKGKMSDDRKRKMSDDGTRRVNDDDQRERESDDRRRSEQIRKRKPSQASPRRRASDLPPTRGANAVETKKGSDAEKKKKKSTSGEEITRRRIDDGEKEEDKEKESGSQLFRIDNAFSLFGTTSTDNHELVRNNFSTNDDEVTILKREIPTSDLYATTTTSTTHAGTIASSLDDEVAEDDYGMRAVTLENHHHEWADSRKDNEGGGGGEEAGGGENDIAEEDAEPRFRSSSYVNGSEGAEEETSTSLFHGLFDLPNFSSLVEPIGKRDLDETCEESSLPLRDSYDVDPRLLRPLIEFGWKREVVMRNQSVSNINLSKASDTYYFSPCGKKFRTKRELVTFLDDIGNVELSEENFLFSKRLLGASVNEELRMAKANNK